MSTEAQGAANQANAQQSTGPKSPEGKSAISQNNFRHGLSGHFQVLAWEPQCEYDALFASLRLQHKPETCFEVSLVEKMAQHYWLSQRAIRCQNACLADGFPKGGDDKGLALYIRYQNTHDRAFYKALNNLLKLRAEKRKQEIGFESQKHKEAEETRRQTRETRKQDLHHWAVLLAGAKVDHQWALTANQRLPQIVAAIEEEDRLEAQKAA